MRNGLLNIEANRSARKYSRSENLRRILWGGGMLFFRFSPRIAFGWRIFLLRLMGAQIGRNTHIYNTAIIYMPWNLKIGDNSAIGEYAFIYNLGPIVIGNSSTISQRAHLCSGTHDFNDPALPLVKTSITIKDAAWICADAFIGPNVTVEEGAIVGARAVVTKNVAPWVIVAGNPARFIKKRELKS